jgi:hypothetical protein
MFSRFGNEIYQAGDHALDKSHVAAAFAGSAIAVTEIVLHVDDEQHAVAWIDAL